MAGKGMTMEEFRAGLASEAREENATLKQDLDKLHKEFSKYKKEKKEEIELLQKHVKALQNRCYVLTSGAMCAHCNIEECPYGFTAEDEMAAAEYMTKNKLPRNEETLKKVGEFIAKRREERIEKIFKGDKKDERRN